MKKLWNEYNISEDFRETGSLESLLDKIHHNINLSDNHSNKNIPIRKYKSFFTILTRVAAVFSVPLMIYFLLTWGKNINKNERVTPVITKNIKVISPVGSRTFIELPDGTQVHLNHGSKLSYPQIFSGESRKVVLEGEAYFTVAHDPDKPFQVETRNLLVTAMGTEFNLMAYTDHHYIEATLAEGKIVMQKKEDGEKHKTIRVMEPGEHLRYLTEQNSFSCAEEDVNKYISWKDGILIFKNDSLKDIAFRLGRWYNIDFEFKCDSLKEFPYTATFIDETLTQILDLLQLATPIKYEITPRVKLPDGSFSKPKVIIDSK
ncbi:MAG: DUF4974 domain-containing protein [Prolixibacteraceae bacterium]|nr:DUF4974 domain-containing protein [Prolixibacteraceae bacterium]